MMKKMLPAGIIMFLFLLPLYGQVIFNFSDGTQEWKVVGFGSNYTLPLQGEAEPDHSTSAGNPDGTISTTDRFSETFFSAPPSVKGDRSSAFGKNISFDIKISYTDNTPYAALILIGGTEVNEKVLYFTLSPTSVDQWETRTIPLLGQGWKIGSWQGADATDDDMRAVLENLQGIYINAEWRTGPDLTYLDNVVFPFATPASDYDINSDGVVDALDVTLLANMLCGHLPLNAKSDVNQDGVTNVLDLEFLLLKVNGAIH